MIGIVQKDKRYNSFQAPSLAILKLKHKTKYRSIYLNMCISSPANDSLEAYILIKIQVHLYPIKALHSKMLNGL